jgi:ParB family chromosome partitioning protein
MSEIQYIPLSQLQPSSRNVRKTGGQSIEDLAASIASVGLLQSLVVSPAGKAFEVVAGGRRLRALMQLAKDDKLDADYRVPCQVVEAGSAHEASLAENSIRQAMHPADQFEAFQGLAMQGLSDAEIAARFGCTERHVAQLLKLARVSPKLVALYRKDEATLEQLQALAITDDVAAQEKVWNAARAGWQRDPDRLRSALTEREIEADSAFAKFVGVEAYEKAGGIVRRDLFSEDAWLVDHKLATKLAQKKLDERAAKLQKDEGWAWAEGRITFDYDDKRKLGNDGYNKGSPVVSAEVKANAGVVVTINSSGNSEIWRGLVRPEDKKALAAASKKAGKTAAAAGAAAATDKKPGEISFAAVQRLQAEATGIIQAEVAGSPRTALALLVVELARKAFYEGYGDRQWVHISRDHTGRITGPAREVLDACAGAKRMEALEAQWRKKLPSSKAVLLEWALGQEYTVLGSLLAFLVAREIDVVDLAGGGRTDQGVRALASATKVDLAAHWAPTEDWLASLPKAVVLEQLRDAAGKAAVAQVEKLSKAQLPAQALPLFPAGWLPKALRPADKARKPKAARGKSAAAGDDEGADE